MQTFQYELPDSFSQYSKSPGLASVVEVVVYVGQQRIPYAKILETYSPAVLWPGSGSEPVDDHFRQIQQFDVFLQDVKN